MENSMRALCRLEAASPTATAPPSGALNSRSRRAPCSPPSRRARCSRQSHRARPGAHANQPRRQAHGGRRKADAKAKQAEAHTARRAAAAEAAARLPPCDESGALVKRGQSVPWSWKVRYFELSRAEAAGAAAGATAESCGGARPAVDRLDATCPGGPPCRAAQHARRSRAAPARLRVSHASQRCSADIEADVAWDGWGAQVFARVQGGRRSRCTRGADNANVAPRGVWGHARAGADAGHGPTGMA